MKQLMSIALGLSLLVPMASFAQDTGGCKRTVPKSAAGKKSRTHARKGKITTKSTTDPKTPK